MPRRLVLLALLAALAGCSPRLLVETVFLGDNFVLTTGVAYGPDAAQRLDVYRPRRAERQAPVVVFLYGGRWQSGARRDYRLVGDALTRRGFLVVIPDYRLYPAVLFPAWVEDAARAVAWTRAHAASFDGDTARVFVIGHSAGAHTATLLDLDEHYLRDAGVPAGGVKGFVSLAGPVDTSWTDPDVQALMGPAAGWPNSYPRTFIDGTEPPLLLLHGDGDHTVAPANSTHLAARILERGGCARTVAYPHVGHVELVVALALPRLGIAPVLGDVADFIQRPDCAR
jgi:acetyl esterase/lipase